MTNETPPAKKRHRARWVIAFTALATFIFVMVITCSIANRTPNVPGVPAGDQNTSQGPGQGSHSVVYRVSGTGTSKANSITYTTDGQATSNQESNVRLPWSKTLTLPAGQPMELVQVTAQGSGVGTVNVVIEVDGKLFKQASATDYGVASANGNIGTLGR